MLPAYSRMLTIQSAGIGQIQVDDYIVRIKRREPPDAGDIIGLVEVVETQTRHPFHSFEELRRILADCPTPSSGTENKEGIKQVKDKER